MRRFKEAAVALAQADGRDWTALSPSEKVRTLNRVRAILDVLREPDEAMVEAGAEIIRNVRQGESEIAYHNDVISAWRYMIDALRGSYLPPT